MLFYARIRRSSSLYRRLQQRGVEKEIVDGVLFKKQSSELFESGELEHHQIECMRKNPAIEVALIGNRSIAKNVISHV